MSETEENLAEAIKYHQAGHLVEAERLYRKLLASDHRNADAHHLLGLICHQTGRNDDALNLIQEAIAINASAAVFYSNLGAALKDIGRYESALSACRAAICLAPGFSDAFYNMGAALSALGRSGDAVAVYGTVVRLKPDHAEARSNYGNSLNGLSRRDDAIAAYRAVLCLKPDHAEARSNLGATLNELGRHDEAVIVLGIALRIKPDFAEAHSNLGISLDALGRFEDAIAAHSSAVRINPFYARGHSNLGTALTSAGRPDDAAVAFKKAVCIMPDYANAYYNIGVALRDIGNFELAVATYRMARHIQPEHVETQTNLAAVFYDLGHLPETIAGLKTALVIDPGFAEANACLGNALLVNGQFEEGWRKYDRRWETKALQGVSRKFDMPQWHGENLDGRTILLHAEQGIGDAIQFSRFVPMVADRGGRVVVEAHRPISRLLRGLPGVERIVAKGDPLPPADFHCPLLSLPRVFGTKIETIPAPIPYLAAEPERVAKWRARLGPSGFRIGIVWQGSPVYKSDQTRSTPLANFSSLAMIPGVRLISLQKQHGLDQLDQLPAGMAVETLGADFDEGPDGFLDTVAVMMSLDLVITVDTAAGHIAGALGRPVWLALSVAPHWPWMLGRDDTPWYPNTRLFRQTSRGDWMSVFEEMADRLRAVVAGDTPSPKGSVEVPISVGELLDKITILEIKEQRIADSAKLTNVLRELSALRSVVERLLDLDEAAHRIVDALRRVNTLLWDVEDGIRDCEREKDFGGKFVDLARSVYRLNDERARLKKQLNEMTGSDLVEEKSYAETTSITPA